jgi:hypothetical protein
LALALIRDRAWTELGRTMGPIQQALMHVLLDGLARLERAITFCGTPRDRVAYWFPNTMKISTDGCIIALSISSSS